MGESSQSWDPYNWNPWSQAKQFVCTELDEQLCEGLRDPLQDVLEEGKVCLYNVSRQTIPGGWGEQGPAFLCQRCVALLKGSGSC